MASGGQGQGQQIDLSTIPAQQLSQIKKQLDDEIQHLTTSHQNLRGAQQKFRDCIASLKTGLTPQPTPKPLLVPLTSSLYVPGTLASTEHVLVDVGTGFYVEKDVESARKFYERKVEELGGNVKGLEEVVNGKAQNLRVVEEVLRQKMLKGEGGGGGGGQQGQGQPAAAAAGA
ncbi:hypothetical protein MBLNU230_g1079t1 [Neophaeotheca triangularis]